MYKKNIIAFQNLKSQKKPDAIIFDWDNTLVDTWPLIHSAINTTMREMNKEEWSAQKVKDSVHKSMRESFPEIFGDDWMKAGEIYKSSYRSMHLNDLRLLPQAFELIELLHDKKIPQMIVSNKIGITLRKEVNKLNLTNKFFSIIGSQDSNADKPSVAPVELALLGSGLNAKEHDIWFVGDTVADVDCAYNSGCKPIIFGHDNSVSKTISVELLLNGKNNDGPLPLYFKHGELIDVIANCTI